MVKVVKRGDMYRPEKLKNSVMKAGASEKIANKIVASIKVREGMSTLELRDKVIELLKTLDPKAAVAYEAYKRE